MGIVEKNPYVILSKRVGFTFPKVEMLVPKLVIQAHPVDNGEESFLFLTPAPHSKPLPCWMKSYDKQRTCFFLAFSVFVWITLYIWVRLGNSSEGNDSGEVSWPACMCHVTSRMWQKKFAIAYFMDYHIAGIQDEALAKKWCHPVAYGCWQSAPSTVLRRHFSMLNASASKSA